MEDDYVPEVEEEFEEEAVDTATDTATDPYESLYKYHPETILDYAEAVIAKVPLQSVGGKDKNHMSQPFLTVFERTKVLGPTNSKHFPYNEVSRSSKIIFILNIIWVLSLYSFLL